MSPSKRPDILIDALARVQRSGLGFTADFYGSPLPKDREYYKNLEKKVRTLNLSNSVSFHPSVPNTETPDLYRAHDIFVNCSPSGMLDKTIFEAAACGCRVLASSKDFAEQAGQDSYFDGPEELAESLKTTLGVTSFAEPALFVAENNLSTLSEKLFQEI